MKIQLWPIAKIQPYGRNPRINDKTVDSVAASIREFGFRQPIVVDKAGVVVIGHVRLRAALRLRLDRAPVHVVENLSAAQIKALRLADNRTHEDSKWDPALLGAELVELNQDGYDLKHTAFGADELSRLVADGAPAGLKQGAEEDFAPLPPEAPKTVPGELIILGRHRLVCGDATQPEPYARLLEGKRADLIWTDPPYNVDYQGATDKRLKIANDSMSDARFEAFLRAAFSEMLEALKPGGSFYIAHADSRSLDFRQALRAEGGDLKQTLIWVKDSLVVGRQDYQWRHEPILYGWKPGGPHAWHGDRTQTTVLEFKKRARNADHPTTKPVALVEQAILNSTPAGARVLDPFAGSGTTLIAAEKHGRAAYLIELDPRFCDVITRRWEIATGRAAERQPPAAPRRAAAGGRRRG